MRTDITMAAAKSRTINYVRVGKHIIAFVITAGAVLLTTAVATPHWLVLRTPTRDRNTYVGLFEACYQGCTAFVDMPTFKLTDDFRAVVVMLITAIMLYVLGSVTIFVNLAKKSSKRCFSMASGVFCFFGAFLNISAVAIYVDADKYEYISRVFTYTYGYSCHMSWASIVFGGIGWLLNTGLYYYTQLYGDPNAKKKKRPAAEVTVEEQDPDNAEIMTISGQQMTTTSSYDNPTLTDSSEDNNVEMTNPNS